MGKKAFIAVITVSLFLISLFEMQVVEVTQANFVPMPTTPPSVVIVNPLNSSTQPKNTLVEFNVTVPDAWLRVIFGYSLDDQPLIEIQRSALSRTSVDQWRFTLQNVSDGPHTLKVSVKIGKTESTDYDRAWHFVGVEGVSSPVNFTVDNIAPQIPTSTPLLPKPLVPEFAVKLIVSPPEVNKTIELAIKNQPFVPYYDSSSGWNISLYYNVRVRVNNGNWGILYRTEDVPVQSNGESTILLYPSDAPDSEYQYFLGDKLLDLFLGDQVDFQVEVMIGYIYRVQQGNFAPYYFAGETSDWSNTQTIIISTSASSSTPTESKSPSPSLTPSPSIPEFPSWIALPVVIVSTLAFVLIRRKLQLVQS